MPRHLVIGASAHAGLAALVREARPDLEVRSNHHTDLTADDLAWGDSYMGFRRPPLGSMGNIRWVHCTGAGVDAWLYPDELPRDILLTRTSESFGPRIAEWALSRALAFTQQLVDLNDAQRQRRWAPRETPMVHGSRVLVVGTGDIGTHVARLFSALGAHVTGVSRSGRGDNAVFPQRAAVDALPSLVSAAEWIDPSWDQQCVGHRLADHRVGSLLRSEQDVVWPLRAVGRGEGRLHYERVPKHVLENRSDELVLQLRF